ncbi:putative GNAT family acetyltransferase [Mycetocola sp. BIGb0189]|uniref:GNAT family N-acetyltransferase n=1 Tax=Mycetocola sp. BIGb0189 TaxID=2940604 RepID=UPI002169D408|nr:GNAT family N-acetyltransferase [Mycetocola sp. BIGb0189]MCS4276896.1 putative GNAT family acetyltransferase [Mycetocola sp. BIGb0189]
MEITRSNEHSRYELREDGMVHATLAFTEREGVTFLTYSYTEPTQRGRGLAAQLVEFAIQDISQDPARRITPTCGYVRGWFAAHPEHQALLAS